MPWSYLDDPEHWRARAREARAVAEHISDPTSKQMMLDVAADYERLAKRAEESLSRVAVLANPVDPFTRSMLEQVQLAGRTIGIEIAPVAMVRALDEVEAAFAAIAKERAGAVVVQAGIFFQNAIADLAIKYRLPSASVLRPFVEAGGLLSYGADLSHMYRRGAVFVSKILQGTKPADLPVEQPTKFELVINLKTAKAIGIDVPLFLQQRADEVIE